MVWSPPRYLVPLAVVALALTLGNASLSVTPADQSLYRSAAGVPDFNDHLAKSS
jgi:hypothetical protein